MCVCVCVFVSVAMARRNILTVVWHFLSHKQHDNVMMTAQAHYDGDDMMMYEFQFHMFIRPVERLYIKREREREKLDISLNCHSNRTTGNVFPHREHERRNFNSFRSRNNRERETNKHTRNVCHHKQHCFTTIFPSFTSHFHNKKIIFSLSLTVIISMNLNHPNENDVAIYEN